MRNGAKSLGDFPACPYCSGAACEPWLDNIEDRLGCGPGRWAFHRCRDCGSAVLFPQPKASELSSYYPPVYNFAPELAGDHRWRRALACVEDRCFYRPQYEAQVRLTLRGIGWRDRKAGRILDVGCGRGLRLNLLRGRGFDVQGMDFQPEIVSYVEKTMGIPCVACDFEQLPQHFRAESFDLVTAFCVLEHVPDVHGVLRICHDLLTPGGWLVAAVPLVDCPQATILQSRWAQVVEAPRHVTLPSAEGIRRACVAAGFEEVVVRPASVLTCAGYVGLSVAQGSSTMHMYGKGGWRALAARVLGALVTLAAIPRCIADNHLWKRPAEGLVFARKPGSTPVRQSA